MIAIYARVSTEEQAKRGFSLQDQLRAGAAKAGTNDVLHYVDDGISGDFLDRPALSRLRHDVQSGVVHQVICLDPDRLSRKLMNQLIISDEIEAHAELLFVNGEYAHTPEGQLFYQMRGAISQFEKAKINERMTRGRREKARQGRVLRDYFIYGYDFDAKRDQFVVNQREAAIVRLVFQLFIHPSSTARGINGIAAYLNRLGVPTKRRKRGFHRQVVRQMLQNRAYIGEFYQNRWNTEGMVGNRFRPPGERIRQRERPREEWILLSIPPLIGRSQFAYAQLLLTQARRRWAGTAKHVYALGGLLRCADCGNTLTGQRRQSWGKEVFVYSDVKRTAGARHPGCGIRLPADEIEPLVWRQVLAWVGAPDAMVERRLLLGRQPLSAADELAVEQSVAQELAHSVAQELAHVNKSIDRLLELVGDNEIDLPVLKDRLVELGRRSIALTAEQERLTKGAVAADAGTSAVAGTATANVVGQLDECWHWLTAGADSCAKSVSAAGQRELLRAVIREVIVHNGGESLEIATM